MSESFGRISIDSGLRKIEVNDEGDYITINLADATFFRRFGELVKWIENQGDMVEALEKEMSSEKEPTTDQKIAAMGKVADICEECGRQIDLFFGPDTCRKVFSGLTAPDALLIAEFFEQITPIMQKAAQERGEKISLKYNRNRRRQK